jgi:hypothetical protein
MMPALRQNFLPVTVFCAILTAVLLIQKIIQMPCMPKKTAAPSGQIFSVLTQHRPVPTTTVMVTAIRAILPVLMGQLKTVTTKIRAPIQTHWKYVTIKLITTVTVNLIVQIPTVIRILIVWPLPVN